MDNLNIEQLNKNAKKKYLNELLLNENSVNVKLYILDIISKTFDPSFVAPVENFLDDENSLIREKSILTLKNLGNIRNPNKILELFKDSNSNVRIAAIEFLTFFYPKKVTDLFINTLKSEENQNVIMKLIDSLKHLGINTKLVDYIVFEILLIDDNEIVLALYDSLRFISKKDSSNLFLNMVFNLLENEKINFSINEIKDSGEFVVLLKENILSSLKNFPNSNIYKMLIDFVKSDIKNLSMLKSAIYSVGVLKIKSLSMPLFKLLIRIDNIDIKRVIVSTIGNIGEKDSVAALIDLMDREAELAWDIANVLNKFNDEHAIEPLVNILLNAETIEQKQDAASLLSNYKNDRVIKALVSVFENNDEIRFDVAQALMKNGDFKLVDIMKKNLSSENEDLVYHSIMVLSKIGDTRILDPLMPMLISKSERIRKISFDTLMGIGDVSIFEYMLQLILIVTDSDIKEHLEMNIKRLSKMFASSNDYIIKVFNSINHSKNIRERAYETLKSISPNKLSKKLIKWLSDCDENMKINIISMLGEIGDMSAVNILKSYSTNYSQMESVRIAAIDALIDSNLGEKILNMDVYNEQ